MSGGPGQLLAGVVGAAIGFVVGGPQGAAIGWTLGTMAGGIIWPMDGGTQQGPRLTDRAVQTSSYGQPIPRVWGSYRLAGNVIWATDIVETATVKRVGKTLFSKGTKVTSYSYSGNFAVALCAGPVAAIGRVWADGKLIHDPYTTGRYDAHITKYLGTETQSPDSHIQADQGVSVTPAFRGVAYVVFHGLPLADFSSRIPVIHVEIGGQPVAEQYRDGAVTDLGAGNWFYTPSLPDKVANTWDDIVTVIDTDTMTAIQFRPFYDFAAVEAAMIEYYAGYGSGVDSTNYTRALLDPSSGDVIVFLQGATYRSAICRFSLTGGVPTLQWTRKIVTDAAWGATWLFGSRIFATDTLGTMTYGFDAATGAELWRVLVASTVTGAVEAYFATYRSADNSVYSIWRGGTVVKQSMLTGAIITHQVGAVTADNGTAPIVYDAATDSVIVITEDGFNRLDPTTLAVLATYPLAGPFAATGFSSAQAHNFGPDNAVNGTFYLQNADKTFYQYETAGLTLLWSATLPTTGVLPMDVYTDMGNPFALAGSGRPFFGYAGGTTFYNFGSTGGVAVLSDIITDICESCGMTASDIDVSALTDTSVAGYCVGRESTGRAAIEPLMSAFAVDGPERDGKLTFQFRKTALDMTVALSDLGAGGGEAEDVRVTERRRQEIELPLMVTVTYASAALDYQNNSQSIKRIDDTIEAGDPRSQEYPLVMSDLQASTISARLLFLAWIERTSFSFTLPPAYLRLDAGDVLDLPLDDGTVRVLLTKVEIGGDAVVGCEAVATDDLAYLPPSEAPVSPIFPGQSVPTVQDMAVVVLDAPLLSSDDDEYGYYIGAQGEDQTWTGGEVYASKDASAYEYALTVGAETPIGYAVTALPSHASALIDRTNTVTVVLPTAPTLTSITELELLAGGNQIMLGSELLGFATATPIGATTWVLSVLLRGVQGTEWASDHAIGERVVLLDNIASVEEAISGINQPRYFKGVSVGEFLDDQSAITFTGTGVRLKPLSSVHITGTRDGGNNLSLTWFRRARLDADWRDGVETPLDEPAEAYEVDVMSGSAVLRTISSSTAGASYSASQQTADGTTPGDPVSVRVYQLSTRVGRGYPGTATV